MLHDSAFLADLQIISNPVDSSLKCSGEACPRHGPNIHTLNGFDITPESVTKPFVRARFIAPLGRNGELMQTGEINVVPMVQNDRTVLEHLLKVLVADALALGKSINLDSNEALLRLIPVLCAYFSREELIDLLGKKVTARILELHQLEVVQNIFLEGRLQHLLHVFNAAHIPLMLFKGPALAHTVYPNAAMRTYHDFDAFIHPADMARANQLLTQMGYVFYEEYRSNTIDRHRTGYNYTLEQQDSWLKVEIELHTAPHPSEIGALFDIEAMWAKAQPITVLDQPALTMHPIDYLLYLCWHYRFHSFTRLLWLYDLVVMLRSVGPELDWMALIQAARQQQLATTLYYCLSWCRDLFGVDIPREVFVRLHPPLISRLIVEHIAMPDIAEALVLSRMQTHRIIAHRTMVDSPAGIFKVGLQTLFPPPTALARRYIDHSRLPVQLYFLFYVVHPWLTLAKGCRYLLGNRRKGRRSKKQVSYHRAHQIREK